MKYKKYKVGDRVFYENYEGAIETAIVLKIREESYISDGGWPVHYQWLILWQEDRCSSGIENYNCLPQNSPKYKELMKRYKEFDKQKDSIVQSIMAIVSPWNKDIQEEILKLIDIKIKES